MLDNIIPKNISIDFIKIDVEGAEYNVIKGAKNTILRNRPVIIFEFGKSSSKYYNVNAEKLYSLLCKDLKLKILNKTDPLNYKEFNDLYNFIAYPKE